jgi:hypothetical protein
MQDGPQPSGQPAQPNNHISEYFQPKTTTRRTSSSLDDEVVVSLQRIVSMEDEYSKLKNALLSDMGEEESGEEEEEINPPQQSKNPPNPAKSPPNPAKSPPNLESVECPPNLNLANSETPPPQPRPLPPRQLLGPV